MNRTISQSIFSVLGVLAALGAAEVALRPWASAWREKPYARAAEVRQYYEGISTAHYAADGERLTGNPPVANAPHILILGDSHVEAMQVNDTETMGSVLERRARSAGSPLPSGGLNVRGLNVHQYGWSSAAAPLYALVAPELIKRWDPELVVVMLNTGDIEQAFVGPVRMDAASDELKIIDERSGPSSSWEFRVGTPILTGSVLAYHLYRAARLMQEAAFLDGEVLPTEASPPLATPDAARKTVRLLKAAYGPRLLIVYDMYLHGLHTDTVDVGSVERALFDACQEAAVECVSTRAALTRDREAGNRFSRGFSNTPPGGGHWNRVGHEIMADLIWQYAQPRLGRR